MEYKGEIQNINSFLAEGIVLLTSNSFNTLYWEFIQANTTGTMRRLLEQEINDFR